MLAKKVTSVTYCVFDTSLSTLDIIPNIWKVLLLSPFYKWGYQGLERITANPRP